MSKSILIRGGTVVNADREFLADVVGLLVDAQHSAASDVALESRTGTEHESIFLD